MRGRKKQPERVMDKELRKTFYEKLIDCRKMQKQIKNLGRFGVIGEERYRKAYSDSENRAFDYFKRRMEDSGLFTETDDCGNLYGILEGKNGGRIMTGSHLDGVKSGGLYDGVAGVVASLEAVSAISRIYKPHNDIVAVAWRAEESARFGLPYIGSRAAFGRLEAEHLFMKKSGDMPIIDAIEKADFEYDGKPHLDPSEIRAYLELHAEQGRTLLEEGISIGIVNSISGNVRFGMQLTGKPDHTGGCKMNYRKDALLAASEIALLTEQLPKQFRHTEGFHITATATDIRNMGSSTTVPYLVLLSVEIRCNRKKQLQHAYDILEDKIKETVKKRGVELDLNDKVFSTPIESLDPDIMKLLAESVGYLGEKYIELPSGAGHDAAVLAKLKIPTGMFFVPSVDGHAHNPDEFTSIEDIKKGTKVLAETIIRIDEEKN